MTKGVTFAPFTFPLQLKKTQYESENEQQPLTLIKNNEKSLPVPTGGTGIREIIEIKEFLAWSICQ